MPDQLKDNVILARFHSKHRSRLSNHDGTAATLQVYHRSWRQSAASCLTRPCFGWPAVPVHQDLANLDAFAAGTQGILHGLATADDAHSTQTFGKVHTTVLRACGCCDCQLCKWQKSKTSFHNLRIHATVSPDCTQHAESRMRLALAVLEPSQHTTSVLTTRRM